MNKKIGIGVLSWQAHTTLTKSLESYKHNGFLDLFDRKMIYFSDISDEDKAIAKRYGWDYAGGANEGIAGGMKKLAEHMDTDYILLLQNDNPIIEEADFARRHIRDAISLLEDGTADLARMRHRWKVGEGFADVDKYLRYYRPVKIAEAFQANEHNIKTLACHPATRMLNKTFKSHNLHRFKGRSVFIEENPHLVHPDVIQKKGDFFVIDSAAIDFTDQCLLISRQLWLEEFVPFVDTHPSSRTPNGFQAPEICINGPWWRNSHFKVLQGHGLFTHARFDGSFRPDHWTQQNFQKTA